MFKIYSEDYPFEVDEQGNVRNKHTKKRYRQSLRKGYYRVSTVVDGERVSVNVHRMVAGLFVPRENLEDDQVNHIDGDKLNNHYKNLEWCTSQGNRLHAYDRGIQKPSKGEANGRSLAKESDVHNICRLLEQGLRNKDISDELGVSKNIVRDIKKGLSWRDISSQYDFRVTWELGFSTATAKWICYRLQEGLDPVEIHTLCSNNRVSIEGIKKIRDGSAYQDISKHFEL